MTIESLSNKQLSIEIEQHIKAMIKDVVYSLYPSIHTEIKHGSEEAKKHMKIKHYQAIDRIKMYLAYHIAHVSFYDFSLEDMVKAKDRKTLKAIHKKVQELSYEFVREEWHSNLKETFFKQKEMKKESERLEKKAILARMEIGEDKGFVRIENEEIKIVKNIADATEFVATSNTEVALDKVKKEIFDKYMWEVRTFFNPKMKGRHIYQD